MFVLIVALGLQWTWIKLVFRVTIAALFVVGAMASSWSAAVFVRGAAGVGGGVVTVAFVSPGGGSRSAEPDSCCDVGLPEGSSDDD